ncbi:helix-turn-helix domain-containing protein [Halorubrum amylolyticum]|uniref:hypothetical protein n=1 Tax=Halorubrum amylolyticum TaxID=2508724 RepID=UPI001008C002|nr:hypothetical protein [Halorubrum amylolyticum]
MAGRPEDTTDEEILNFFRESEDLVFSTGEVAATLSYSQPGMFKRLTKLEEGGKVESKKLGGTKAWWLAENERED